MHAAYALFQSKLAGGHALYKHGLSQCQIKHCSQGVYFVVHSTNPSTRTSNCSGVMNINKRKIKTLISFLSLMNKVSEGNVKQVIGVQTAN